MTCGCGPSTSGLCWVQGDPASVTLRLVSDDTSLDLTTVGSITLTVARDSAGREVLLTLSLAATAPDEATGSIAVVDLPLGSWWWDIIAVSGTEIVLRTAPSRVQIKAGVGHV